MRQNYKNVIYNFLPSTLKTLSATKTVKAQQNDKLTAMKLKEEVKILDSAKHVKKYSFPIV